LSGLLNLEAEIQQASVNLGPGLSHKLVKVTKSQLPFKANTSLTVW
jgi:hypothetical protein